METSTSMFPYFFNTSYPDDYDYTELEGNFTIAPTIEAFFDGDLLLHPFWMKYRPMIESIPPIVHYILGIYIAIVGIIGVSGNLLVIYMFTVNKSLRTPSNVFIINLAISDLGFSAINGFPLMTISCFMKKWYFGKLACELYGFLGGLFGFNSINTLAWISYDRMYVISKPFEAMRKASVKRSSLQLLIVWAWALGWSVPPLVGWGAYIPEGFMTSCSFDYLTRDLLNQTYVWSMFAGGFVAPVLMIVYCYVEIIRAVTAQAKMMNKTAEKMGAKAEKGEKAKKQEIALAKVAAVTIIFFMLSWLPYAFVSLGAMAGFDAILTPYTCVIPVLFAKASAMWNPILYALSHPRFRAALDELFPSLVLCRGLCMDKGGDDGEESDGEKGGKKPAKKRKTPAQDDDSTGSEISEMSETSGVSATVNETQVQMTPNPVRRAGGASPSGATHRPSNQPGGPGQLQPQGPRVVPGSIPQEPIPQQTTSSQSRSFRSSIGRAAGEAYKNLIDAYVGLKNVTDKLADRRAQMTLEENHPAVSRKSSSVGYENQAYQPNIGAAGQPLPPPGQPPVGHHPGVYSVPMIYQQGAIQQPQIMGFSAPGFGPTIVGQDPREFYRAASPVQFIQMPVGTPFVSATPSSNPSDTTSLTNSTVCPSTTPPSGTPANGSPAPTSSVCVSVTAPCVTPPSDTAAPSTNSSTHASPSITSQSASIPSPTPSAASSSPVNDSATSLPITRSPTPSITSASTASEQPNTNSSSSLEAALAPKVSAETPTPPPTNPPSPEPTSGSANKEAVPRVDFAPEPEVIEPVSSGGEV